MNTWTPDADQIARVQKIVEMALPKYRPSVVGLNCDAALLRAVANETTKDLLLADDHSEHSEASRKDSVNRISGDFNKIISLLTKVQFQANLFVLSSFSELPTALNLCGNCGEGLIFTDAKLLENLAIAPEDTAKHIWARINLDGTTSIKDGKVCVFFSAVHEAGRSAYVRVTNDLKLVIARPARTSFETHQESLQKEMLVDVWNEVRRFQNNEALIIEEGPGEYSIIVGPGIVKGFSIGEFLRVSADDVIGSLKSISEKFTLKIPRCYFGLTDLPLRGALIGNFLDCRVGIMDVDAFLGDEDWERRLRIHHAFCHFCFSNAMPSMVYACFHEWLDLKEFLFDECLKAWIKNGSQSETLLDSYRNSPDHAAIRHEKHHWLVFEKTPFVKSILDAQEVAAVNRITVAEIERIRKSKFDCYVYVMEDLRNNLFKIGKSKTPSKRERTLQSEVPQIVMRLSMPADESHEKQLHEHFDEKRIRGEWFTLSPDELLWLVSFLKKHGDVARASIDHEWLGKIAFNA